MMTMRRLLAAACFGAALLSSASDHGGSLLVGASAFPRNNLQSLRRIFQARKSETGRELLPSDEDSNSTTTFSPRPAARNESVSGNNTRGNWTAPLDGNIMKKKKVTFFYVVAFGDGFTDNGNTKIMTDGEWPPDGFGYYKSNTFTNGRTWADIIAAPYIQHLYNNFAYDGATLSRDIQGTTGLDHDIPVPSIKEQITSEYLQTFAPDEKRLRSTLFLLLGGVNDFYTNYFTDIVAAVKSQDLEGAKGIVSDAAEAVATSAVNDVKLLLDAGARTVVVGNQIDLSSYPYSVQFAEGDEKILNMFSHATSTYNRRLEAKVHALQKEVQKEDKDIILVRFSSIMERVLHSPGYRGIKVIDKPCLDGARMCARADQYLFWDDLHPTRVFHSLMAEEVRKELNSTYTGFA